MSESVDSKRSKPRLPVFSYVFLVLTGACSALLVFTLVNKIIDMVWGAESGKPLAPWLTPVPEDYFVVVLFISVFGMMITATMMAYTGPWTVAEVLGRSSPSVISQYYGASVAAVGAALVSPAIEGAMIAAVIAVFFALMATKRWRQFIVDERELEDSVAARKRVREYGTRVRADVTDVHVSMWVGDPIFSVTACFDTPAGVREVTSRMSTSVREAPVRGGTVIVWYDDGDAIDMERDEDSILDPDAEERYREPSA